MSTITRTTLRAETINSAATEFNVSACRNPADLSSFDRFVTVVVSTGACGVQSYLTPDECDELAAMLVQAAKEQREIIADPIPTGEATDSDFGAFMDAAQ